jgi:sigma-B regulation protein RsbU (phosphoserine phosphatase)
MKRLISLRTRILLIVLFFLFLLGAAFVLYSMLTTVNYKRLRLEGIEKTVEIETERVNKIITEIEGGAIFYAISGTLCYESQSDELGEALAVEYLSGLPAAVGGGFWFEPYAFRNDRLRAGFYAFRDKAGRIRLDDTFFMDDYDYHNKIWYREIIDNITRPHQVAWTRPYTDDSGSFSLMTTAGAGIFNESGRLIAISTSDWEIEDVIKQLIAIHPTENSFVLLCVPEKDYIISSTHLNSFAGDSIRNLPWDINSSSITLDGVNYISFNRHMDNGWLLSVQIPENEIFAEVENRNSRFSILIAFVSFAMLFLAYLLISTFINTPIKKLTSGVAHIALGNLDERINISSKDELGQLANTFNKMTVDLKNSIEENAREREEKKRISTELGVAKEIQASMLPCIFPPFPERKEFEIYASMVPAREVGGDFYDFYFIDKNNLAVVIADVSGKGIPAALFMVIAKTLIKNCSSCKRPKNVFESVNKKLCENNETCLFVTAFMGFYNIPTGRFVYVNAGHNPPLIKKRGGSFEFLKTDPCFVLGWMEAAEYKETEITLEKGDALYLYTDGVTEAMDAQKTLFGEQRLVDALNRNRDSSPKDLLSAIKREVDSFSGEAEQADDITMLALKVSDTEKNETMRELRLEAKLENLEAVTAFVNSELEKRGYPSNLQNEIDIAVEEVFVNIANYAYEGGSGAVVISISATDRATIKFEDSGKPYNPLEQADPDLEKSPADREIGGLGIYLVKKIMDAVEYSRSEGKNILVISKIPQF